MKKFTITIVDTLENLEASTKIIPDGIVAKIAGTDSFRVGNGKHTFSELKDAGGTLNVEVDKIDIGAVKAINFETFETNLDENGVLTVKNLTWFDGGSYDLPYNSYSRRLDGGEMKIDGI